MHTSRPLLSFKDSKDVLFLFFFLFLYLNVCCGYSFEGGARRQNVCFYGEVRWIFPVVPLNTPLYPFQLGRPKPIPSQTV